MKTIRKTMAQALVDFLAQQHVSRDGETSRFFGGVLGIFGHGNVAGIGEALRHCDGLRYILPRNEQAMVHTAAAYARMANRLQCMACTSSVGPGATNMVTGAAGATINRVPVLLLPGDVFARRDVGPVLQELEYRGGGDVSVNDCFRPASVFWDRIVRPEQLVPAALEAMRVLTSPAETGAVTLALPQDVQTEAFAYPVEFFEPRVWRIPRHRPDEEAVREALEAIQAAERPVLIAGGGVIYSGAEAVLAEFAEATGIPVVETQAGKGSLAHDHACLLGAVGATGTLAANRIVREADLVIGVGTRYSDFTTASRTAFQCPEVRFINLNVAEADATKLSGLSVVGDARESLREMRAGLNGSRVAERYREQTATLRDQWREEERRLFELQGRDGLSQSSVIGLLNEVLDPKDVVVAAAGSLPGDLHKLFHARDSKSYHVEYGYSCMGYEVAGGLGVKLLDPSREVFVLVGDGSYLMMAQELTTAVQEGVKLTVLIFDNQGFASIGGLSESLGSAGFGTRYRLRGASSGYGEDPVAVDLAANAASLGAEVDRADTLEDLKAALERARSAHGVRAIVMRTDRASRVPSFESAWDVPVAEVSDDPMVQSARKRWETVRGRHRHLVRPFSRRS